MDTRLGTLGKLRPPFVSTNERIMFLGLNGRYKSLGGGLLSDELSEFVLSNLVCSALPRMSPRPVGGLWRVCIGITIATEGT